MKKLLLSAVSLAALSGSAFAADLASRKAPIVATSAPNWTGIYFGVNGGFGGGNGFANLASVGPVATGFTAASVGNLSFGYGNFLVGGQAGYNYQFSNNFVAGIETDMQWSAIQGQATQNVLATSGAITTLKEGSASFGQTWFGTTRGRLGYAIGDRILPYVTGGIGYSGLKGNVWNATGASGISNQDAPNATASTTAFNQGNLNTTRIGWVIGAGLEYALSRSFTLKTEYLYQNYGSVALPYTSYVPLMAGGAPGYGNYYVQNFDIHTLRAGINWRFGQQNGDWVDTASSITKDISSPLPTDTFSYNWSGAYIGANGGFGGATGTANMLGTGPSVPQFSPVVAGNFSYGYGNFFVGGQVGYNYQLNNKIVLGLESDMQYSPIQSRTTASKLDILGAYTVFNQSQTNFGQTWFGTTRARVGYAVTDRVLPYITGGVAYSQLVANMSNFSSSTGPFNFPYANGVTSQGYTSNVKVGWAAGAGLEYALSRNISAKTEYLYQNYGGLEVDYTSYAAGASAGVGRYSTSEFGVHSLRAGLNYKITEMVAPVVAKY